MAFISSGYNPAKPMEGRISDIGPRKYNEFFPPVIARNFGKWLYHEILEPGVLVHVAESGETCYTVRVGGTRTMSITHIRELCDIADKYCGGHLRWTTRMGAGRRMFLKSSNRTSITALTGPEASVAGV